jgi:hypothetical protein
VIGFPEGIYANNANDGRWAVDRQEEYSAAGYYYYYYYYCLLLLLLIIIIIVTVTKSYSVYIKYYSKQGEKIMVLVRILMSKSGFKDKVLINYYYYYY